MVDRTYCTAADYARLTGHDRTTIAVYIKQGKIKAFKKKKPNGRYRICGYCFDPDWVGRIRKENPVSGRRWSRTELYILRVHIHAPLDDLTKLLKNRSRAAIAAMRCRKRKQEAVS